jgi:hypothetical protein
MFWQPPYQNKKTPIPYRDESLYPWFHPVLAKMPSQSLITGNTPAKLTKIQPGSFEVVIMLGLRKDAYSLRHLISERLTRHNRFLGITIKLITWIIKNYI